jgi:predicted nucleotidyltransferase
MSETKKVTHQDILEMARRITIAAQPIKIILFGSHARGNPRPTSDVDLLVIEKDPVIQRRESARLRTLLQDFKTPIDVVVFGQAFAERYWDIPGSVLYPAFREGTVLYGE